MDYNKPDDSWQRDAACYPEANNDFFLAGAWINENHHERLTAEMICAECPVQTECLQDALHDRDAEGLRAGYWFSSGALLAKDKERLKRERPAFGRSARTRQKYPRTSITNGGTAS